MDRLHKLLIDLNEEINKTKSDFTRDDESLDSYKSELLGMAHSSIYNILLHAQDILSSLSDPTIKENLTEPWLQGMIAITENNMTTIHDFVMSAVGNDDNSSEGSTKKKPGLWDNIRKKKEREGKKYKPAKPGDKDRPDSKTWKKLTDENKKV